GTEAEVSSGAAAAAGSAGVVFTSFFVSSAGDSGAGAAAAAGRTFSLSKDMMGGLRDSYPLFYEIISCGIPVGVIPGHCPEKPVNPLTWPRNSSWDKQMLRA